MSASARNSAMSRHPALNRMPRDFLDCATPHLPIPNIHFKGDAP